MNREVSLEAPVHQVFAVQNKKMSNLHYGNHYTLLQIRKYQILHCRTQDASRKQTTVQELHS